jgi:hypothetical protein
MVGGSETLSGAATNALSGFMNTAGASSSAQQEMQNLARQLAACLGLPSIIQPGPPTKPAEATPTAMIAGAGGPCPPNNCVNDKHEWQIVPAPDPPPQVKKQQILKDKIASLRNAAKKLRELAQKLRDAGDDKGAEGKNNDAEGKDLEADAAEKDDVKDPKDMSGMKEKGKVWIVCKCCKLVKHREIDHLDREDQNEPDKITAIVECKFKAESGLDQHDRVQLKEQLDAARQNGVKLKIKFRGGDKLKQSLEDFQKNNPGTELVPM